MPPELALYLALYLALVILYTGCLLACFVAPWQYQRSLWRVCKHCRKDEHQGPC